MRRVAAPAGDRARAAEAVLARVWSELHDFELEPGVAAWEAMDAETIARVLAVVEPRRSRPAPDAEGQAG